MARKKKKIEENPHIIKLPNGTSRVHLDYKEVNDFKMLGFVLSHLEEVKIIDSEPTLELSMRELNDTLVNNKSKSTRLDSWVQTLRNFISNNVVTVDDKANKRFEIYQIISGGYIPYIESNNPDEPKRIDLDGNIKIRFNPFHFKYMNKIKETTQFYLEDILPVLNKQTIQLYLYIRSMNKHPENINSLVLSEKDLFNLFKVDTSSYMNKKKWKRADGTIGESEWFNRSMFLKRNLELAINEINEKCVLVDNVSYEKLEGEEYQYRIYYENKHLLQYRLNSNKKLDKDIQHILELIYMNMRRHIFINYATKREFKGSITSAEERALKTFDMASFNNFKPLISDSIINKAIDAVEFRPIDYNNSTDVNRAIIIGAQNAEELVGIIDKPTSLKDLSCNFSIVASYVLKVYKEGYAKKSQPVVEEPYVNPFDNEEDTNPFHQPDLFNGEDDRLSVSDMYDEDDNY